MLSTDGTLTSVSAVPPVGDEVNESINWHIINDFNQSLHEKALKKIAKWTKRQINFPTQQNTLVYRDCQKNHILPLVLYNMSNTVTVWLPQKSQTMNHWLQDVKQWHAVTVRLPAKPQTTKCWLQHVPHTQLQSGYQWNHRPQRVGYNTSHTHSYSLATSEITDHKVLATTHPTHTVTVWLPSKPQTTKCWLQHVPHTQLQSGYQQNHRPQSVGYNMSHTVTVWLLNKPQTTQGCLQHVSNSYKKTSISEATVEIGTVIFDIVETAIFWYSSNSHMLI